MTRNFTAALCLLFLIISCSETPKKTDNSSPGKDSTSTVTTPEQQTPPVAGNFDIEKISEAKNFEGSFPYFKLPTDYVFTDPNKYHGEGETKELDKEYFYNNGVYFPMEGKTYKAEIRIDDRKSGNKPFSKLEIQKSFDELIAGIGGVKINAGTPLQDGEADRLKKIDPNAYSDGYLHSCHNYDNVHTYVIKTKEKAVFVQFNLGSEQTSFTVLEPKPFKNTMGILTAPAIQKQLEEKGKAILYINFDTDKATLLPDGKQFVREIATLLSNNPELKLSIEGHTDNSGTATHNKELSAQRAETVMKELVALGTGSARLTAKGMGSESPLVANDTESSRAQNRRVEIIKI